MTARVIDLLRQLKHGGFLVWKRVRRVGGRGRQNVSDAYLTVLERARPYSYDATRYPGAFFVAPTRQDTAAPSELPRRIYTLWTGTNAMTDNRRKGLDSLRRLNAGLEVVLVTPADLDDHLLPEHPLHPAYRHLSLVHRSDYLRCYLMHFNGGGYADIKTYRHDWTDSWQQLHDRPEAWALGYTEVASDMCAQLPGTIGRDLRRHYRALIGNGAYLVRPDTPLTQLWYDELIRRMDRYADALATAPGDERGNNAGYPIPWTGLLGDIFQPICLRYSDRLIHDDRIRPQFHTYR